MSNWYEEMGAAMRAREIALNGVKRWQLKVTEAEDRIAELALQQPDAGVTTKPAPATVTSGIAADYADSAE